MSAKDSHTIEKEEQLSSHSHQEDADNPQIAIDPAAEKKLVRKIDIHLIPVLCILLVCTFLDRSALRSLVPSQLTIPGSTLAMLVFRVLRHH